MGQLDRFVVRQGQGTTQIKGANRWFIHVRIAFRYVGITRAAWRSCVAILISFDDQSR